MDEKQKQRYWYIECADCTENNPVTPAESKDEPQKCPHCGSTKIKSHEQFSLF